MQGGVRKRGTTWSYYFDLGKIDGKRKKKEKGGFRTKKEAEVHYSVSGWCVLMKTVNILPLIHLSIAVGLYTMKCILPLIITA